MVGLSFISKFKSLAHPVKRLLAHFGHAELARMVWVLQRG
jgi:hypothetical protein